MGSKRREPVLLGGLSAVLLALFLLPHLMAQAMTAAKPGPPPPPDPAIAYIDLNALKIMNADGSNKQTLLEAPSGIYHSGPNWSPDGTQLVFASNIMGTGIYVINRDGTGLRKVIATNALDVQSIQPVWSPVPIASQYMIAFSDGDLYAVNLDGTGLVALTQTPDLGEFGPTWNPTATRLAANVHDYSAGAGDIYVFDLAYTNGALIVVGQTNLTDAGPLADSRATMPDWGKTGDRIALMERVSDSLRRIWVVDLVDPYSPVQLTNNNVDINPSWSPSDSQIAFMRFVRNNRAIHVMNADGSSIKNIGAPKGSAFQNFPDWRRNP